MKERTIADVIEKVSTWRALYNGIMIPGTAAGEHKLQRMCLKDAAARIGISKKSLDDYLLHLRFGKKFGYDFEKYKHENIGKLRLFVKEEKAKMKKVNGGQKISSKSVEQEDDQAIIGLA